MKIKPKGAFGTRYNDTIHCLIINESEKWNNNSFITASLVQICQNKPRIHIWMSCFAVSHIYFSIWYVPVLLRYYTVPGYE